MAIVADYIVVGAGLTGATIARMLSDAGRDVCVLEAKDRVGGNVADAVHPCGIRYNLYGPHYFRTSSVRVRDFSQRFAKFYPYIATVMSQVGSELFSWPLHRATFQRFKAASTETETPSDMAPDNFEQAILRLVPSEIYRTFIEGYSCKQWGVTATELDADLAKRIEVKDDGDLRRSKSNFQALPSGGYTAWVQEMLSRIDVHLSTDFHDTHEIVRWRRKLIYTGSIDRFFDHRYGPLRYRAQERMNLFIPGPRHIYPCGQVNLPSPDEGRHVRTIEWRHMLEQDEGPEAGTLLTLEFPLEATDWSKVEYPFPSRLARLHYERYAVLSRECHDVLFCGRLGEYRYLDMYQAIARAMMHGDHLLNEMPA